MARNDDLLELAIICRTSHAASAAVVGWLLASASEETVSEALQWAKEARRAWEPGDGHLALVRERYGEPNGMR